MSLEIKFDERNFRKMDRKNFGDLPTIGQVIPGIRRSPFSGVSAKTKKIIISSTISVLLIAALVLSAFALTSFTSSASGSGIPTLNGASPLPENRLVASGAIVPTATVWYHGELVGEYESDRGCVSDAIAHFELELGENDKVNFDGGDRIFWGMDIRIDEVIFGTTSVLEEIPYETIEIPSQTVPKGERQIQTEGVNGVTGKIIHTKTVNGEIVLTDTVEETVFKKPVTEEVLVGTGGVYTAPDGKEYNYSYYIDVVATAYTHTGDPTYCGTVAEVGVIAVDPRYIPLRSNVYVIGNYGDYGVCRAEDIGGGIKRARIDVFLDTEAECVQFGRRNMRCYVLE